MKRYISLIMAAIVLCAAMMAAKSLRLIYPNGGEILHLNSTVIIKWSSTDIGGKIVIVLYQKGIKYLTVSSGTENTGMFSWRIPGNIPPGDRYRLRIRAAEDLSVNDFSDRDFKITHNQ
jgi:hypothetical protein